MQKVRDLLDMQMRTTKVCTKLQKKRVSTTKKYSSKSDFSQTFAIPVRFLRFEDGKNGDLFFSSDDNDDDKKTESLSLR